MSPGGRAPRGEREGVGPLARASRVPIHNTDRAVCAGLSGAIARGEAEPARLVFEGSAGQSFGAFLAAGMDVTLVGEANESFGKGMSGGRLVARPPAAATFRASENAILGNVALYGATGGEAYVCGAAGERFAVRNSGAVAVVEAVGDHGCEYMTRGCVVVLGRTGRNFAAGMSGGVAYVLDTDGRLAVRCNPDGVELAPLDPTDEARVKALVLAHYQATESDLAWRVLSDWRTARDRFVRITPKPPHVPKALDPTADAAAG